MLLRYNESAVSFTCSLKVLINNVCFTDVFFFQENVGLKKLNVSFNGFGTEGTALMGVALATNRTLLELDMSKNRITEFDLKLFTKQMAQNDTLQILRVI